MCSGRTTSVNETQSARFTCNLRWSDVTYSNNCQRQGYENGGLHKVTQGSEWTDTLSLTHSRIPGLPPHSWRRHDHTRFFYDFISCLRTTSISPPERDRVPLHTSQLCSTTQVSVTNRSDNTTRLSHGKVHKIIHTRCTHRHFWTWSDMCMSLAALLCRLENRHHLSCPPRRLTVHSDRWPLIVVVDGLANFGGWLIPDRISRTSVVMTQGEFLVLIGDV
jgi:hypothetical protein